MPDDESGKKIEVQLTDFSSDHLRLVALKEQEAGKLFRCGWICVTIIVFMLCSTCAAVEIWGQPQQVQR